MGSCHIQIQVDGDGKDRTFSVLDESTGISTQAVDKGLHILQRGENHGCGPLKRAYATPLVSRFDKCGNFNHDKEFEPQL